MVALSFEQGLMIQILRYTLVAGGAYIIFWKALDGYFASRRIQKRPLKKNQIAKELMYSGITIVLFSFNYLLLAKLYQSDWTLIYSNFHEFNLAYYLLSIPLVFILHDFYFYWTHRLLHTKWLFKKVHLIHHNSTNPTPLTSLAFHPVEAIIQGAFLPLVVMLIPLHVSVVIILVAGSYIYNVIGHLGYEFYPKGFPEHPFWGLFLTATHHSHHHKSTNFNFGLYFTFWDRLMDTTIPNYFGIFDAIVSPRETRGAG